MEREHSKDDTYCLPGKETFAYSIGHNLRLAVYIIEWFKSLGSCVHVQVMVCVPEVGRIVVSVKVSTFESLGHVNK